MAKGEKMVCIYLPPELFKILDDTTYKKGVPRSTYIRDLLLDHFAKGSEDTRVNLLGRGERK